MSAHKLTPGLIVNADDLGIHPNINAGILSAYRKGIVSSASMIMTTGYVAETQKDIADNPGLPVGLHLCLTQGTAIAPVAKIRGLASEDGIFKLKASHLVMLRRHNSASLLDQIRVEFSAQFALAKDLGVNLTHVDSHQHIHMNPMLFDIVQELAPKFGVSTIRLVSEPVSSLFIAGEIGEVVRRRNHVKWALLRYLAGKIAPRLQTTDRFFGIVHSGVISKRVLLSLFRSAPRDQSLEICIHPGIQIKPRSDAVVDRSGIDQFTTSRFRQVEHDALIDEEVKYEIQRRRLRLSSFNGTGKNCFA